jgi:hypothetical protein
LLCVYVFQKWSDTSWGAVLIVIYEFYMVGSPISWGMQIWYNHLCIFKRRETMSEVMNLSTSLESGWHRQSSFPECFRSESWHPRICAENECGACGSGK